MTPLVWKTRKAAIAGLVSLGVTSPTLTLQHAYKMAPFGVELTVGPPDRPNRQIKSALKLWYDRVDRTYVIGNNLVGMT